MLITFVLMFGMAAMAKPMVLTLIGEKWLPSVIYLQLLCFVGIFHPLQAINQNMLKVQGLSNLVLMLEIIKKALVVPVIFVGIVYGIKVMIAAMVLHAMAGYFLDSYYSGRLIGYSIGSQIKDIFPSFSIAILIGGFIFAIGYYVSLSDLKTLLLQGFIFVILTIGIFEIFRINDYLFIKNTIMEKLILVNNKRKKSIE